MPEQTFKEFAQKIVKENQRKIQLTIFIFISISFGLVVWHSLETGSIQVLCRSVSCIEIKLSDKEGEFYAWALVYTLISISNLIYFIYLLVNKIPNKAIKKDV